MPLPTCPRCGAAAAADQNFCEGCGARIREALALPAAATAAAAAPASFQVCVNCGAGPGEVTPQGFCNHCGLQRVDHGRDHQEFRVSAALAAVTDRGRRHERNDDAVLVASEGGVQVLVVCDGISRSPHADRAAELAATVAQNALCEALRAGRVDYVATLKSAVRFAQLALREMPAPVPAGGPAHHPAPPPSSPPPPPDAAAPGAGSVPDVAAAAAADAPAPDTTIVAALVQGRRVAVGWLGDSRAYFVGLTQAKLLTHDHSWLNETVDAGLLSREEAQRSRHAHVITRSLGGTSEGDRVDVEASVVSCRLPEPGHLILCTDGVWNYAPGPAELAAAVLTGHPADDVPEALEVARRLVVHSRERGGRDNITAAVAVIP